MTKVLAAAAGAFGVLPQILELVRVEPRIPRSVAAEIFEQVAPVTPGPHGEHMFDGGTAVAG
ncbi:MAG: hypothetical protein JO296_06555 [Pseudonocardiales bacterium]|nr:hypothetical protein [Pseudonocardiales bacterium]MBV9649786.1 hypothetical protein [Pseudonocardiales bacterium]